METKIRGIAIEANEEETYIWIENELKAIQDFVGGNIQVLPMGRGIAMIVNEEGKRLGLPGNFFCDEIGDVIVGNVIFVGINSEDFCSLTIPQERLVFDYLKSKVRIINGRFVR